jgi:anaphase-promoting complex subunit 10
METVQMQISKPDNEFDPFIEELSGQSRDISHQAVWTLSSCKTGFGVDNLIDNSLDTFWQSDGPQPHLVNMQFKQKTKVKDLCLYADYKSDESYTPSRIVIKAGTHVNDLHEIGAYDLVEPAGWIIIPLRDAKNKPIKTWMLQLAVLANHQNGRDTHIRQIKIHSPIETTSIILHPKFSAVEIGEWSTIR